MENPEKKKRFIAKSIFMTHVRRIGWIRTALGGGLMYLSFLEFVFLHLTVITLLYDWLLTPFFKLKRFQIRDYILLDRTKIEGMRAFDKLNCEFCGYANGTAKLWNDEIDELAHAPLNKGNPLIGLVALVYSVCLGLFLVFSFIFSKILFFAIASFLGLHWANTRAIWNRLKEEQFAAAHKTPLKLMLRLAKVYSESLATNLEQIEAGWCPLKHIETEHAIIPEHHANFFERDKLVEAIEQLAKEGTVSPRKPRY